MKISSAIVAHHGIVAGMYDDLGIGKIIDEIIPKQGQHKLAATETAEEDAAGSSLSKVSIS